MKDKINASITPSGSMELLSRSEVARLKDTSKGGLYKLLRRCCLAVLNSGSDEDNIHQLEDYPDFKIKVIQQDRGLKLVVENAPASAFVDGVMIKGLQEMLLAVLRDIIFVNNRLKELSLDLSDTEGRTNAVFEILRNAGVLIPGIDPNLVVCWGGHAISRREYDFSKGVGYQLGLRGMDIVTGCGTGAMKGPMKGATIAHAKQRKQQRRYIGISEPGIIGTEPPNAIVNQLVVMPDIEKRLEAFVRLGHVVIVFPGGAGTVEEILYLLGILSHPDNAETVLPLVFVGDLDSREYFSEIDNFLVAAMGPKIRDLYEIITDSPEVIARRITKLVKDVRKSRIKHRDAFYFNWRLVVPETHQIPFEPTHEHMAALTITQSQDVHVLTSNLRKAFSGIVAGNVKIDTINEIAKSGPFELRGDPLLMGHIDRLLQMLVKQNRMRISAEDYQPCYRIVVD